MCLQGSRQTSLRMAMAQQTSNHVGMSALTQQHMHTVGLGYLVHFGIKLFPQLCSGCMPLHPPHHVKLTNPKSESQRPSKPRKVCCASNLYTSTMNFVRVFWLGTLQTPRACQQESPFRLGELWNASVRVPRTKFVFHHRQLPCTMPSDMLSAPRKHFASCQQTRDAWHSNGQTQQICRGHRSAHWALKATLEEEPHNTKSGVHMNPPTIAAIAFTRSPGSLGLRTTNTEATVRSCTNLS